jgi:hypothetical protein
MPKKILFALFVIVFAVSACQTSLSPSALSPQDESKSGGASNPSTSTDNYYEGGSPSSNNGKDGVRLVIRNANLTIVLEDPDAALKFISNLANSMEGYVVSSYGYQTTTSEGVEVPRGTITIRVPEARLDETLSAIRGLVSDLKDIQSESITGQDVTEEYVDLESQLRNLESTEAQLLEIQKKAETTEDVLAVFNELKNVRSEIEQIKGRMEYLQESARLSSVTVELVAKASIEPVTLAGWEPQGIVLDALQALINAGKFLVEALIWICIFLLPIALVIGVPAFFIRRFVRRYQAKRKPILPPFPPYPPTQPPAQINQ